MGEGLACDIVNDAADNGILWVNAAGNDAQSHYYGFWSDDDSDHDSNNWHNFSPEDEVLSLEAEKGDEIRVFLTWNDWPDLSIRTTICTFISINSSGDLEGRSSKKVLTVQNSFRWCSCQNGVDDYKVEEIGKVRNCCSQRGRSAQKAENMVAQLTILKSIRSRRTVSGVLRTPEGP